MMTLHDNITIPETVFVQEIDGETVLLDTVNEESLGLDETAAVIWHYLSESGSLSKAHDEINKEYEVDAVQLERDICHFVQELVDAGLVQLLA
jgi:hypothetical protein